VVEKISENLGSKREDWRNLDDLELYTSDFSSDIMRVIKYRKMRLVGVCSMLQGDAKLI
jgi:hypothetical protein